MNIAIVDDNAADLVAARDFIREHIAQNFPDAPCSVDTFDQATDFLNVFKPGSYDLLVLDIFMKPLNGIELAQIIRERDPDTAITFLTNSDDHIMEGYSVFAVGYFLKPLTKNAAQFAKTFAHIFPPRDKLLTVRAGGMSFSVPYKKIRYVDIDSRHNVCIHIPDKKISTANHYEDICEILSDDARFLECYHRLIVNMDFIRLMEGEDFILTDGTRIPISKRKNRAAKQKYLSYLIER